VLALAPDAEAQQAVEDLRGSQECDEQATATLPSEISHDPAAFIRFARTMRSHGAFVVAEQYLADAQAALGGDLSIREEREELQIARAGQRVAIARCRANSDPHPKAQTLVGRLEIEHQRLESEILHLRCERLPGDRHLRLELARKLKQAGNYSGAIQRLQEARGDQALAAEVLLELGECWQHLRQFEKALDYYQQAILEAEERREPRPLAVALYRTGVLAAAMGKNGEAREALTKLVAIEPGYKDARERLDKVPPN
jgi:tetratricopeptide (TPR) repeat protein